MRYTRLLTAVVIANTLCLCLANALRLSVGGLLWLYPGSLLAAFALLRGLTFARVSVQPTRGMMLWMLATAAVLAVPRLPYVLEWIPGAVVHVAWDDTQRLPGLISMTLSERFPLRHFANQDYLYSYYYGAITPWAVLKLGIPILTLKDVLFLGNSGYVLLVLLSLLEVGARLVRSRGQLWGLIVFCTAFSGLDWLADVTLNAARFIDFHEWWACGTSRLHGDALIASFFNTLFWSINNFIGFYACVLAFIVWHHGRFCQRTVKAWVVGLLLIGAFYSSVFAFLPALLFIGVEYRAVWRRFRHPRVCLPLLVILLLPCFLLIGNSESGNFLPATFRLVLTGTFWLDKLLSFPVWLLAISLVELAGLPILLLACMPRMLRMERRYFLAAWLFFVSTYLISYTWHNNYSMRGMLLPTFVFFVLGVRHLPAWHWGAFRCWPIVIRGGAGVVMGLYCVGVWLDARNLVWMSSEIINLAYVVRGRPVPDRFSVSYRDLVRDCRVRYYDPGDDIPMRYYNAEKLLRIPSEQMVGDERVQMGPRVSQTWFHD